MMHLINHIHAASQAGEYPALLIAGGGLLPDNNMGRRK